jgi:hypothetical protein
MSFGFSVGDFIAATQIAKRQLDILTASQSESDKDSVIVLSFRSLQAQRIKDLQFELSKLSLRKMQNINTPTTDGSDVPLNAEIDAKLNDYGVFGPSLFSDLSNPSLST